NIVVYHSAIKQTIINRCKYHFFVRCTCGKQNRKLIETIEDFILYKDDIRFYAMGKKAPNLDLQHQDLANLVNGLKHKISALSDSLDSNMYVIKSKNAEIRDLKRLLKEKEDMLRAKEEEIERLKSNQNHTELSVLHKKTEQLEHAAKRTEKFQRKMKEFQRKIGEMEKKLEEKNKEIEELKKENQALKSQNENKKRAKPSSMTGSRQTGTNSIELISVTSAETLLGDEVFQASEVHRGGRFLKKNRKELIERIVAVKPIVDELLQFMGHHKYEKILQAPTEYEQKRQLYDIMDKGGAKLQIEFYKCLLKHEKYLVEDLEKSP
ncbi:hypothetical protein PGIGA_G00200590, partial [Pangasianodon gigas]|nr:hypothetical protein [Pangasianodon gigas]